MAEEFVHDRKINLRGGNIMINYSENAEKLYHIQVAPGEVGR